MLIFYILFVLNSILFAHSQNVRDRDPPPVESTIMDDKKCVEVQSICHNLSENNDLLILECLLATNPERLNKLQEPCQEVIWNHIQKITEDQTVHNILSPYCGTELSNLHCRIDNKGNYLKCILNNIKDIQDDKCTSALSRVENVAFTDYRWISSFLEHCTDDIKTLHCARIDSKSFSQSETVQCLQNNILGVRDDCKREVFRLSEIQSNSMKLDAQLYIECADDHMRYCSHTHAGSGRMFPCLMKKFNQDPGQIAAKCRNQLLRREKLIAQDFRVSKGLLRACREDIKKTHCRKQISNDKTLRLAQILLCLENVMKNGTKIDPECEAEMTEHRKILMEDYRLSPEIVNDCKNETTLYCKGYDHGGRTIHCLMNHARNPISRIGDRCLRALEDLVRETDVGENWSVDPVLQQACDPVVKVACKNVQGGDARIMSCLMDALRSDIMTDDCEDALLEIQYFVARDFKLDPQLYRACKQDASNFCHTFESWESNYQGPSYGPQVLTCLYRQAYQENTKIKKNCVVQIQRVMKQRAISVELHPEIEEDCVRDLGAFCQDKTQKGQEIQCLQENLEKLSDECRNTIKDYTEAEAEDVEINPMITKYCGKIIDTLCPHNEEDSVMDCLIENKNNPVVKTNPSCRASIEHFQIISLKNYKFTHKFKLACKSHAMRLCSTKTTISDVIACLSENILNATVQGLKSPISKECRQQLKAQIFQQREKIDFNPELKAACNLDIKKHCSNIPMENSRVLECLQTVPNGKLSNSCAKQIFRVKRLEVYDNSVDYALMTMCAETIDQFCHNQDKESVFNCLKIYKDKDGFSKKCRTIVMHRLAEQQSNNLLNPSLQHNCQLDISKFCKHELTIITTNYNRQVEDSVIKCLKVQFKQMKLSDTCEKEIADILKERALNIELDPLIQTVCKNELETICKFDTDEWGKAEECLKTAFMNKKIPTGECRIEVANLIDESRADIGVDPLLQRACALDLLKYCNNVEQGNGRHIQCLKITMEADSHNLSPNCKKKLSERLSMYKRAADFVPPEGFKDLYIQVNESPSRYYFAVVILMVFGAIFFVGAFCGRISKNKYTLLKNK